MTPAEKAEALTRNEVVAMVRDAIKAAECAKEIPMPHTWPELIWCAVKILGVGTIVAMAVVGVIGFVAWSTLPPMIQGNIEFQQSLTKNLEQQTTNMERQGENMEHQTENIIAQTNNINAQTSAIQEVQSAVAGIAKSTETRDQKWVEFSSQVNSVHQSQCETQQQMVKTLTAIEESITKQ